MQSAVDTVRAAVARDAGVIDGHLSSLGGQMDRIGQGVADAHRAVLGAVGDVAEGVAAGRHVLENAVARAAEQLLAAVRAGHQEQDEALGEAAAGLLAAVEAVTVAQSGGLGEIVTVLEALRGELLAQHEEAFGEVAAGQAEHREALAEAKAGLLGGVESLAAGQGEVLGMVVLGREEQREVLGAVADAAGRTGAALEDLAAGQVEQRQVLDGLAAGQQRAAGDTAAVRDAVEAGLGELGEEQRRHVEGVVDAVRESGRELGAVLAAQSGDIGHLVAAVPGIGEVLAHLSAQAEEIRAEVDGEKALERLRDLGDRLTAELAVLRALGDVPEAVADRVSVVVSELSAAVRAIMDDIRGALVDMHADVQHTAKLLPVIESAQERTAVDVSGLRAQMGDLANEVGGVSSQVSGVAGDVRSLAEGMRLVLGAAARTERTLLAMERRLAPAVPVAEEAAR